MTGYKGNGFVHLKCDDGREKQEPLYTPKIYLKDDSNKTTSRNVGPWCINCNRYVKPEECFDRRLNFD